MKHQMGSFGAVVCFILSLTLCGCLSSESSESESEFSQESKFSDEEGLQTQETQKKEESAQEETIQNKKLQEDQKEDQKNLKHENPELHPEPQTPKKTGDTTDSAASQENALEPIKYVNKGDQSQKKHTQADQNESASEPHAESKNQKKPGTYASELILAVQASTPKSNPDQVIALCENARKQLHQNETDFLRWINATDKDGNSALHYAARGGTPNIVKHLLLLGASPSLINSQGLTALDESQQTNHPAISKLLCERIADLPGKHWPPRARGDTPLHVAIELQSFDLVKRLIDGGHDVTKENAQGSTPLIHSVETNNIEIVTLLLTQDTVMQDILEHSSFSRTGSTRLPRQFFELQPCEYRPVVKLVADRLLETLKKPSSMLPAEFDPLDFAIQSNLPDLVWQLIKHNPRLAQKDPQDLTALVQALELGNPLIIECLLEQTEILRTLIEQASSDRCASQPIFARIKQGNAHSQTSISTQLCRKLAQSLNAQRSHLLGNESPLHFAIRLKLGGLVEELLESGANLEEKNALGWTPLFSAIIRDNHSDNLKIFKLLLDKKPNLEATSSWQPPKGSQTINGIQLFQNAYKMSFCNNTPTDRIGWFSSYRPERTKALTKSLTAAHATAVLGKLEMLKLLHTHGAQIHARQTEHGWTSLEIATLENQIQIAQYLLSIGAKADEPFGLWQLTLAFCCARFGQLEIFEALMAAGADITQKASGQQTLLIMAAWHGHLNVVCAILEQLTQNASQSLHARSNFSDLLAAQDFSGATALYRAAEYGHLNIIQELLHWTTQQENARKNSRKNSQEAERLLTIRTKNGKLPLHAAIETNRENKNAQLIEYLRKHTPKTVQDPLSPQTT
jgi:ankyrin repeat protein